MWSKDDVLGYLTLAGHGMCFTNTQSDVATFESHLNTQAEIPTPVPPTATATATHTATPLPTATFTATPTLTPLPQPLVLPLLLTERCGTAPRFIDVALIVDTSSSMAGAPIDAARQGALAFLAALRLDRGDQLALVTFHSQPSLQLHLTADRPTANDAIQRLAVTGTGTAIDAAVSLATFELSGPRHRPGNARLMVLMTDGRQSGSVEPLLEAAEAARAAGVVVYAIGLGPNADIPTLRAVAGSDSRTFHSPSPAELQATYREIAQRQLCPGETFWPRSR
jgi:uncharacterized protein YegL